MTHEQIESGLEKELKEFKKEFDKLMDKYPNIRVAIDVRERLIAWSSSGMIHKKIYIEKQP
jgi:hypothetical protein